MLVAVKDRMDPRLCEFPYQLSSVEHDAHRSIGTWLVRGFDRQQVMVQYHQVEYSARDQLSLASLAVVIAKCLQPIGGAMADIAILIIGTY